MNNAPKLSIVITVVTGRDALRRCLEALQPQAAGVGGEIIVPYDEWCHDVLVLTDAFPTVQFLRVRDLGAASHADVPAHGHRLYDRRRAIGLDAARGEIVAMTEDHAVPAPDWCRQILAVHEAPHGVIGGAIQNEIDRPLNWAWYYCDFGRYGLPMSPGVADYVSDVNLAYKRSALEAVRDVWRHSYHETTVHWALQARGIQLHLDPRPVVYQHRSPMPIRSALRERRDWGRIFGETRRAEVSAVRTLMYIAGSPLLPPLLTWRLFKNMRRQGRSMGQIVRALPLASALVTAWSFGEVIGYVAGAPAADIALHRRGPSGAAEGG